MNINIGFKENKRQIKKRSRKEQYTWAESKSQRGKKGRDSPAERDGDDSGAVLGDLEEHGHGEVEVGPRRVAPAAIVTW